MTLERGRRVMNVREKTLTGIATGMMGVPWTLLILRAFDWARQSPVAERMILGYAGFMIFSGIFALVAYVVSARKSGLLKVCVAVNGLYLLFAPAVLALMFWA